MPEKALFDPGFAPYVYSFTENTYAIEEMMRSLKSTHQKKFRYGILAPQIRQLFENSVSFYLGCLVWAKYIKETMPNKELENNPFYGVNLEEKNITEDEICFEVTNLINYFDKFERDSKFYLGKITPLPEVWKKVAARYKEFLLANKSFVNTKLTNDLVLPEGLEDFITQSNEENLTAINNAIKSKQISSLLQLL